MQQSGEPEGAGIFEEEPGLTPAEQVALSSQRVGHPGSGTGCLAEIAWADA